MRHFFKERITIRRIAFGLVLLVTLSGVVYLQHRHLGQIKKWRPYRDSLYLPRGEYVKLISLGYDMIMADFIWLRAIQAFGGHYLSDKNYEAIVNLFDVITDLNNYFISAYLFGDTVIGEESGDYKKGLALIEKGIVKAPRYTYKLGYWGGYDCVWNLKEYERAKYFYRMALKAPDCPDYVSRLLAYVDEKMGNYHIAYEKRVEDYLRAIDNKDKILEQISKNKIIDVITQWHIAILRDAAKRYKSEYGKDITNVNQLVESKVLGQYKAPVYSRLQEKINSLLEQQKKLVPFFREIIEYSIVTFDNQLPPEPRGTGYYVVYNQTSDSEYFISTIAEARERVERFLKGMRDLIKKYKEEHGIYPKTLNDLFPGKKWEAVDMFGNPWNYSPETGELKSFVFPDL